MQDLITKYNISDTFYNRYFVINAENRLMVELSKFLWFKVGKLLNPLKKKMYIEEFLNEEIINFYENNELNIPQIEISITTKCTLNCKDCNTLMPSFKERGCHHTLTFSAFKEQLDNLCNSVSRIRHFVFLGGEPLVNPELPEMLDYACKKENIDLIRIVTNTTILPSQKLINVFHNNPNRAYFYLSDYRDNPALVNILKQEEIKKLLQENKIKCQVGENLNWIKEQAFSTKKFDKITTPETIKNCFRLHCTQIFNNKIDVCSKPLSARMLGLLDTNDDIQVSNNVNLKNELIRFYQKEYADSCPYCLISNEIVEKAIQI